MLVDGLQTAVLRPNDRPPAVLGDETALARHDAALPVYTPADREDLHAVAQNAMPEAEQGATIERARRLALPEHRGSITRGSDDPGGVKLE